MPMTLVIGIIEDNEAIRRDPGKRGPGSQSRDSSNDIIHHSSYSDQHRVGASVYQNHGANPGRADDDQVDGMIRR